MQNSTDFNRGGDYLQTGPNHMQTFPELGELIFRPCRTIRRESGIVFEQLTPDMEQTGRKDTPWRTNLAYMETLGVWIIGARRGLIAFITDLPEGYTHFRVVKALPNCVTIAPCEPDRAILYAAFPKHEPDRLGLGQLRGIAKRNAVELTRYLDAETVRRAVSRARLTDILIESFDAGEEVHDVVSLKAALDGAQMYAAGVESQIASGKSKMPADTWRKIMQKLSSLRSDILNSLGRYDAAPPRDGFATFADLIDTDMAVPRGFGED